MILNEIIGKGAQAAIYKADNYALKVFNKNHKKSGAEKINTWIKDV